MALADHSLPADPFQRAPFPAGERRLRSTLLASASLVYAFYVFRFFNNVDDDAFIPLRYGLNFLGGHGWVMNPGERVEGCTSPLHLWVVTALLKALSLDGAIWSLKVLGFFLGLGVLQGTAKLGSLLAPARPYLGPLASLLLAVRPEFALSMTNGLETGLAVALILAGTLCFLSGEQGVPWSSALFAFAALARPELVLVLPAILILHRIGGGKVAAKALLPFAVPLLVFLAFRWGYYGSLVPNTYFAKRMPLEAAAGPGLEYFATYGSYLGPMLGVLVLGTLPLGLFLLDRRADCLLAAVGILFLFAIASGGTWMRDGRFVAPAMPLLAVLWTAAAVQGVLSPRAKVTRTLLGLPLVLLVAVDAVDRYRRLDGEAFLTSLVEPGPRIELGRWKSAQPEGRRRMADWIREHVPAGETVAITEIGIPGILSMRTRVLDMRGLTDARVARMESCPHSQVAVTCNGWSDGGGEMLEYVLQKKPHGVLAFDAGEGTHPRFKDLYREVSRFELVGDHGWPWRMTGWVRRDAPTSAGARGSRLPRPTGPFSRLPAPPGTTSRGRP